MGLYSDYILRSSKCQHKLCLKILKGAAVTVPRNSQSDIHLSSAGKVEGVEGHLGGGLPNGLSSQQTHCFAWIAQRALPLIVQQLAEAADTGRHENSLASQMWKLKVDRSPV